MFKKNYKTSKTILSLFIAGTIFLMGNNIYCRGSKKDSDVKQEKKDKLYIKEFGETTGNPIDTGFIFIGGEYIDAPYIISRKGLGVFINDMMVRKWMTWPIKVYSGDIDPQLPKEIRKNTSFYDETFKNYIREKIAYVQKNHTQEEECKIMEQVYRNLPCVKKAELDKNLPSILHITTFGGEEHPVGLLVPRRKGIADKEGILKELDRWRETYEKGLQEGDCFFIPGDSEESAPLISLGGDMLVEELPQIIKILRSSRSADEKMKELIKKDLLDENDKEIVINFKASSQLEDRLEKFIKSQQADKEDNEKEEKEGK